MLISYLKVSNAALGLLAAGSEAAVDFAADSNVALQESGAAAAEALAPASVTLR